MMRELCLAGVLAVAGTSVAFAQSGPSAMSAASGKPLRLGYYAITRKDCSAGPVPQILVLEVPKHGTVRITRARLKTKRVPNCPEVDTPTLVVFYRSSPGYTGQDLVTLKIVDPETGQNQSRTFVINVTEAL